MADFDRVQVIGAGKASAAMARAVEHVLGRFIKGGIVNVPDGTAAKLRRIALNPAGHPIPDERGADGARRILEIARAAGTARSADLRDFGRRLGVAARSGSTADSGRQAGDHAPVAQCGRDDPRDQHRPQASEPDQRRAAGRRGVSGYGDHADLVRRDRRRSGRHRFGTHGRRFVDRGAGAVGTAKVRRWGSTENSAMLSAKRPKLRKRKM